MHAERTAHLGALSPCVAGAGCAGAWSGSLIAPLRTQQVFDLGASEGRLIRYTNSGEASGDYDRVVAYAGIAVT